MNNRRCVVSCIAVIFQLADMTIGVLRLTVNKIIVKRVNAAINVDGAKMAYKTRSSAKDIDL